MFKTLACLCVLVSLAACDGALERKNKGEAPSKDLGNAQAQDMRAVVDQGQPADMKILQDLGRADLGSTDQGVSNDMTAVVDMSTLDQGSDMAPDMPPPVVVKDRVIFIKHPHGFVTSELWPSQDLNSLPLPPTLEPFTSRRDQLVVINGLDFNIPPEIRRGATHYFTGYVLTGTLNPVPISSGSENYWWPNSLSIDQLISQHFSDTFTSHYSLIVDGVPQPSSPIRQLLSFTGQGTPILPDHSIDDLIAKMEGFFVTLPVTDASKQAFERFKGEHAQAPPLNNKPKLRERMMELVCIGMSHPGFSRTATVALDSMTARDNYPSVVTFPRSVNEIAHEITFNDNASKAQYLSIQKLWATEVARLADCLNTFPQADGTSALDHTLIVWVTDSGREFPSVHATRDIPVILLGGLTSKLKRGQYLTIDRQMNDLWATVASIMGVPLTGFGDPASPPQPIQELLAP